MGDMDSRWEKNMSNYTFDWLLNEVFNNSVKKLSNGTIEEIMIWSYSMVI